VEGFHKSVLRLEASQSTELAEYNGVDSSLVVDIWDDEVAGVLVLESNGSTNVIERGDGDFDGATNTPAFYADSTINQAANSAYGIPAVNLTQEFDLARDSYTIVLTKAPKPGETVTVNLIAEPTRTQRGAGLLGIRAFTQEVELLDLDGPPAQKLEFTTANWFAPEEVLVNAMYDDRVDGGDSKSFPTKFDLANSLEGPLVVTGGVSEDRSADLERLPRLRNQVKLSQ
jgi:hypothetical protein